MRLSRNQIIVIAMTILGVVELMAGGTVVLAHKSGGPLMDIVTTDPQSQRTGYLASDIGMYMVQLLHIG